MAPCVRKFYIDELKVPNFRPLFLQAIPSPLTKKKIAFDDLKMLNLFRPFLV